MYQGVLRDDARRLGKHKQREEALEESLRKRELYEKVQTVSKPARVLSSSSPLTEDGR
jgi:protein PET117